MEESAVKNKTSKWLIFGCSLAAFFVFLGAMGFTLSSAYKDMETRKAAEQLAYEQETERLQLVHRNTFLEGMTVYGIPVGNLTYEEALPIVSDAIDSNIPQMNIEIEYMGQSFFASESDFEFTTNLEETLTELFNHARSGSYEELTAMRDDIKENGYDVEFRYFAKITSETEFIKDIAEKIAIDPISAGVIIDEENVTITVTKSLNGVELNSDKLSQDIAAVVNAGGYDVKVEAEEKAVPPEVSDSDLLPFVNLRSHAVTSYRSGNSSNRVHNIRKAAGIINGTVIKPGEIFSCNDILGFRTLQSGWKPAGAIIDGGAGTEDQPGGGVCQVSTTIYNAAVTADLEIVYRRNHTKKSAYADGGLDATIDSGRIDFQFRNNTGHDIYIFTWVDRKAQEMHCAIYGETLPYDKIEFVSEFIKEIPPTETEYVQTSALQAPYWQIKNNPIVGTIYEAYAVYYKDDVVVKKVLVNTSKYNMHPLRIYVWRGYAGEPLLPEYQVFSIN